MGSRWSCRHSLREWGCTICRCEACDCVTERRCCVLLLGSKTQQLDGGKIRYVAADALGGVEQDVRFGRIRIA